MTRLRDDPDDFEGAVTAAAASLGLAPLFVEKDYWVTQVLRSLHERRPGAFVLKGGTSLSKGYGLIERFSEDVDILMLPAKEDSAASRERSLARIADQVAADLGVERLDARAPGRGRAAHRADVMSYPRVIHSGVAVPMEDRGVLLESGYAGGEWPSEMVTLIPILCDPLDIDPDEYEDTAPFDVKALHPVRTLLEKITLLHHAATTYIASTPSDERCGRHYYDIYRLLDHRPTLKALEDRGQFGRILSEAETISATHYGGWSQRPSAGYAHSPAFVPAPGSPVRAWLQARYGDAAELMPANTSGRWPSFGQVLKRVQEHSNRL
jgi:hypothetical protein